MRRIVSLLSAGLIAVAISLFATASPAQAAGLNCNAGGEYVGWGEVGTYYPTTLHGGTVRLYSGRSTGNAYGSVYVRAGSWITIDRSNAELTGRYWFTESEVLNSGGYQGCTFKYDWNGWVTTDRVNGYRHGVRICVRWAGSTNCVRNWYSDQDA